MGRREPHRTAASTGQAPVSLRAATPTIEDGLAFARLLEEAQEGMFRGMIGRRAVDIVAQAFLQPGHDLSYEYVTFAHQDGRIVGMASGYTAEAHRSSTDEPLRTAAGWRRHRLAISARLAGRGMRFIDTIADGDFYVRGIAVETEHRGSGIGTRLMGAMKERARAVGSTRLALDVAAKNRAGRRFYERLGMTAEAESRRWFWLPNTNLIRMIKPL